MPIEIKIIAESNQEAGELLAFLAPFYTGRHTPAEAALSHVETVAPVSTRKPRAAKQQDILAGYNAIAATAGAPTVSETTAETVKEAEASVVDELEALISAVEEKTLTRADKIAGIVNVVKRITLPVAREQFKIPATAQPFSMWTDEEIDRVHALAIVAV